MHPLEDAAAVRDFIATGGSVLYLILGVTFAMWTLILERFWYFRRGYPAALAGALAQWQSRAERSSWQARQIRRLLISQVQLELGRSLRLIRGLVAICPLLGLLGTVTGMIEVFTVMAGGSGNARAMAAGVSRATIPTMAGMVAALSGFAASVPLDRFARREGERVADCMTRAGDRRDAP